MAVVALVHWGTAVAGRAPILYGEGAVAHAALLARDGAEYSGGASDSPPIFTAANYPPLYFRIAGLGEPFVVGRIAGVGATLAVAGAIAWRARAGGAAVALALSAAWLATAPVALWGPAVKPDLVALALTVMAVLALERSRVRDVGSSPPGGSGTADNQGGSAIVAGALLALAVLAKPTAALPAVALATWVLLRDDVRLRPEQPRGDRARGRRGVASFGRLLLGAVATGAVAPLLLREFASPDAVFLHVVSWNGLPWSAGSAAALIVVAVLTIGVPVAAAVAFRAVRGPIGTYLVAAAAIVLLGGREGATINYLLDLSAAAALALASIATRVRARTWYPAAAAAQLVVGVAVLNPFGILPGRPPTTGAWGDPARLEVIATLPAGPALVEDSGLLVAHGREPAVDDLFLWSRLVQRGSLDPRELIDAVTGRAFVAVVSQADLERLEEASAFERSRWDPVLVRAVLARYTLGSVRAGMYVYLPR